MDIAYVTFYTDAYPERDAPLLIIRIEADGFQNIFSVLMEKKMAICIS